MGAEDDVRRLFEVLFPEAFLVLETGADGLVEVTVIEAPVPLVTN